MKNLAIAVIFVALAAGARDEEGLVGRWQFDRSHLTNAGFKPAAGKLHAAVVGAAEFSPEPPRALLLNPLTAAGEKPKQSAKGAYLTLPLDAPGPALPARAMTVEAWVRLDKTQEWGGLIGFFQDNGSYEKGWLLGYNQTRFFFALSTSGGGKLTYLTARRAFQPGDWYHVLGTYDGREQRIYVDGRLENAATAQSGDIAYPPKAEYVIGAYRDNDEFYPFSGQIEQASVWSRGLGEAEVLERWNARKARLPGIEPERPKVIDWPTWLRDNQRTATVDGAPALPLRLAWVHKSRHAPAPAWPSEAKQDFWNNKPRLPQRVVYDHAFHLVAVGDLVCFGSSADDQVTALDAATGRVRWTFFAEAPVRLAPSIHEGRVLFGSDDGFVYCLNASDGTLIWKLRGGPEDRRIAGNGRVISVWPVRSGVIVEEGSAFFCAGIYPDQGAFHIAADAKSGKKLGETALDASAQGYMEHRGGKFYLSTGRDPAGAFVTALKKRGKTPGREISAVAPYAFISAGDVRIGGGDGKVTAFSAEEGRELWSTAVEGKAWSLAISQGRLLVGTDRGHVYAYAADAAEPVVHDPPAPVFPEDTKAADRLVEKTGVRRGFALVLGSGEGGLVRELARKTDLRVIGVEADAEKVARSRQSLAAAGLYGKASIHALRPDGKLPYTDYLFNLVVVEGAARRDEVMRVTRPEGGAAVFAGEIVRRGPLEGIGEWTHMYADASNTSCSGDRRVGGPMRLQWFGLPGPERMVDRHHRTVPPLWKSGRLFIPGNERVYGLDAYNGAVLWDTEIPGSRRVAVFRDCGSMAAAEEALYVAAAEKCVALDPEMGTTTKEFPVPGGAREWGYVGVVEDLLLGSATQPGAARRDHSRKIPEKESFWDFVPLVGSDALFSIDRKTGGVRWTHAGAGLIVNSTITVGGGRLFFVESADPRTLEAPAGRAPLSDLVGQGSRLRALDLKTGKPAWSVGADLAAVRHVLYAMFARDCVVLAGTRNSGTGKGSTALYDLHVHSASDGRRLWSATLDYGAAINGEHGEQDHHPVIVGDRLYVEPRVYDLRSGRVLDDWGWKPRRGCGTLSASASTFFFRDQTACMMDPTTKQIVKVAAVTRPGCWINMIPAGGLLLMPEASSGCSCNFAVQTSIAYLPGGK